MSPNDGGGQRTQVTVRLARSSAVPKQGNVGWVVAQNQPTWSTEVNRCSRLSATALYRGVITPVLAVVRLNPDHAMFRGDGGAHEHPLRMCIEKHFCSTWR